MIVGAAIGGAYSALSSGAAGPSIDAAAAWLSRAGCGYGGRMGDTRSSWPWWAALIAATAAVASGPVATVQAAPGDLDASFSKDGKAYLNAFLSADVAGQADGGAVVVGESLSGPDLIARLTGAGKPDKGFGMGGEVTKPFNSSEGVPRAVAIQPDGGIVVAGSLEVPDALFESDLALARYLANGRLDPSFGSGGIATLSTAGADAIESAEDVAIQPDGRIVLAGANPDAGVIARFNADGTPDSTFSGDGWIASSFGFSGASLRAVAPGPAGSVYAAGLASKSVDESDLLVVRVDTTGTPDPGFDADGVRAVDLGAVDGASELAVQPDGYVIAAGSTKSRAALVRLSSAGALDAAFGGDGIVSVPELGGPVAGLALSSEGIYAVGGEGVVVTVRLVASGELDASFSGDGRALVSLGGAFAVAGEAIALAATGGLIVTGSAVLSKDDSIVGVARLGLTAGPPDADADRVLDPADKCPVQLGPKALDGCPRVRRKLTLNESGGMFRGQIRVSAPGADLVRVAYRRCLFSGKVTVFESRSGPDRKLGSAGASSTWALKEKVRDGSYYARLRPRVHGALALCDGDRSNTLRG
jgi:uncharacterized delta-60 repeat protein